MLNLAAAAAVLVLAAVTVGKLAGTRNGGRQDSQERRGRGEAQQAAQELQRLENGTRKVEKQQAAREQQQGRARQPGEPAAQPAARRTVEDFEFDAVTGDWFAAGWLHLHGWPADQGGGQRSSQGTSQRPAPPALKAPWLPH